MKEYRVIRTLNSFKPPLTAIHWTGTNEYRLPAVLREAEALYSREPSVSHHIEAREVGEWVVSQAASPQDGAAKEKKDPSP